MGWTTPLAFRNATTLPLISDEVDERVRFGSAFTAGRILDAIASTPPDAVVRMLFDRPGPQPPVDWEWERDWVKGTPTCIVTYVQRDGAANTFRISGGYFDGGEPIKIKQGTADIVDITADSLGIYTVNVNLLPGYYIVYAEGQNSKRVSRQVSFGN